METYLKTLMVNVRTHPHNAKNKNEAKALWRAQIGSTVFASYIRRILATHYTGLVLDDAYILVFMLNNLPPTTPSVIKKCIECQ